MSEKKTRAMNVKKLQDLIIFLSENGVTKYKDGDLELELIPKFVPEESTLHSDQVISNAQRDSIDESIEFLHSNY